MTIKEMRNRTGLSQNKFGKLLNIPTINISRWEQGVSNPPEYVINLIEEVLYYKGLLNENNLSYEDFPNFEELYKDYLMREIGKREFASRLGVSRSTLDRLIDDFTTKRNDIFLNIDDNVKNMMVEGDEENER